MPLSVPEAGREEVYFRHIDYTGFRREGVLWDIEGHLKDLRTSDFPCVDRGGFIRAGEPFHEMRLRLTVDDDLKIHGIEAVVENAPSKGRRFGNPVGVHQGSPFPHSCQSGMHAFVRFVDRNGGRGVSNGGTGSLFQISSGGETRYDRHLSGLGQCGRSRPARMADVLHRR